MTRGEQRTWWLTAALAAVASGLTLAFVPPSLTSADAGIGALLVIAFALVERLLLSVRLGSDTQNLSLSELPLVLGLFLVSPAALLLSRLLGTGASLSRNGAPLFKRAFAVVQMWLETLLAIGVVALVQPQDATDGLRAAIAAVLVALAVTVNSAAAISAAISVHSGRPRPDVLWLGLQHGLGPAVATTALGVGSLALGVVSPWLLWAPAMTLVVLFLAYRSHTSLLQLNTTQEQLLAFVQAITGQDSVSRTAEQVVHAAVEMLNADGAALFLDSEGAPRCVSTSQRAEDILRRTMDDPPASTSLALLEDAGAIHAPLPAVEGTLAILLRRTEDVANTDLRPVDMLASHASVALASAASRGRLHAQAREAATRARLDSLTGLANRVALMEALEHRIERAEPFCLLMLDLDDFKEVNDALGHGAGDTVLAEVARRFDEVTRDTDILARLGGDEFAIVVAGGATVAREIADRLHQAVDAPIEVQAYSLAIGLSVGVAGYPSHGLDASTLLQHADLAMYESKRLGEPTRLFGAEAGGRAVRALAVSSAFRGALDRHEIKVVFQPLIDLQTRALVGVEALSRWREAELGAVRPDEFVPIAEQTGLVAELTSQVLDSSLAWHQRWLTEGMDLGVSVNLSPRSLLDDDLPKLVSERLDHHGVDPAALTLELTEGSVITDPHRTLAVLRRLARLGVKLSIDDFGTGYSSLAYLRSLPAHEVKIDKSFVLPIAYDETAIPMVTGIVRLCHELGFAVVAEGVENAAVLAVLGDVGCDVGQGFHIARPMAGDAVARWARDRHVSPPLGSPLGP